MREIRYGKEDALYESGNPWSVAGEMLKKGLDLQSPDWREYPEFKENMATVDADKVMAGTDEWLATLGYQREGLYYRCTNEDDREKTIVLFSHGGSSTAFLSRVLNIPFPHMCVVLGHIRHTAITILHFDPRPGVLSMPIVDVMVEARHLEEVKQ